MTVSELLEHFTLTGIGSISLVNDDEKTAEVIKIVDADALEVKEEVLEKCGDRIVVDWAYLSSYKQIGITYKKA